MVVSLRDGFEIKSEQSKFFANWCGLFKEYINF